MQPEKLFTFLSSFSPLTFQLISLFTLLKYSYFCLCSFFIHSASCLFEETVQLSNCSPFLSSFSPLTFQLHCLNMPTLFHTSRSKLPNSKRNNFLNGRCCMNKPRQQHAPTRVDCKGPFIAACSFNYTLLCIYCYLCNALQ